MNAFSNRQKPLTDAQLVAKTSPVMVELNKAEIIQLIQNSLNTTNKSYVDFTDPNQILHQMETDRQRRVAMLASALNRSAAPAARRLLELLHNAFVSGSRDLIESIIDTLHEVLTAAEDIFEGIINLVEDVATGLSDDMDAAVDALTDFFASQPEHLETIAARAEIATKQTISKGAR